MRKGKPEFKLSSYADVTKPPIVQHLSCSCNISAFLSIWERIALGLQANPPTPKIAPNYKDFFKNIFLSYQNNNYNRKKPKI